jgi:hypothetical protein
MCPGELFPLTQQMCLYFSFTQSDVQPFCESILMALLDVIERGDTPQQIAHNDNLIKCELTSLSLNTFSNLLLLLPCSTIRLSIQVLCVSSVSPAAHSHLSMAPSSYASPAFSQKSARTPAIQSSTIISLSRYRLSFGQFLFSLLCFEPAGVCSMFVYPQLRRRREPSHAFRFRDATSTPVPIRSLARCIWYVLVRFRFWWSTCVKNGEMVHFRRVSAFCLPDHLASCRAPTRRLTQPLQESHGAYPPRFSLALEGERTPAHPPPSCFSREEFGRYHSRGSIEGHQRHFPLPYRGQGP